MLFLICTTSFIDYTSVVNLLSNKTVQTLGLARRQSRLRLYQTKLSNSIWNSLEVLFYQIILIYHPLYILRVFTFACFQLQSESLRQHNAFDLGNFILQRYLFWYECRTNNNVKNDVVIQNGLHILLRDYLENWNVLHWKIWDFY